MEIHSEINIAELKALVDVIKMVVWFYVPISLTMFSVVATFLWRITRMMRAELKIISSKIDAEQAIIGHKLDNLNYEREDISKTLAIIEGQLISEIQSRIAAEKHIETMCEEKHRWSGRERRMENGKT